MRWAQRTDPAPPTLMPRFRHARAQPLSVCQSLVLLDSPHTFILTPGRRRRRGGLGRRWRRRRRGVDGLVAPLDRNAAEAKRRDQHHDRLQRGRKGGGAKRGLGGAGFDFSVRFLRRSETPSQPGTEARSQGSRPGKAYNNFAELGRLLCPGLLGGTPLLLL